MSNVIRVVSTVRAPLADLKRFVAYYRNVGADLVHLFFDDPCDPAISSIQETSGVEITVCDSQHWLGVVMAVGDGIEARQIHNAGLALRRAREQRNQWLLHVDADELVCVPGNDLRQWLDLRASTTEAVIFPVWEAIPAVWSHRHHFESCHLFKVQAPHERITLALRLGCRRAFHYGYFCGHVLGKAATRVDSSFDRVDIHFPVRSDGVAAAIEIAEDAAVLHYDSCTFGAWREKWARRKDGSGRANGMRPSRRAQFDDFLAADAVGSIDRLKSEFRRQRHVPVYERAVLRALGLVKYVHLPVSIFTTSSESSSDV